MASLAVAVAGLPRSAAVAERAKEYGLAVVAVSWDDTAREKNSNMGPNISDMTLTVGRLRMPMIRFPNFADLTTDVPMEEIVVPVGNEVLGREKRLVSLRHYLENIKDFLSDSNGCDLVPTGLYYGPMDEHVVVSAQTCILPLTEEKATQFSVELLNYASKPCAPAVLAIVVSNEGTSAQVVSGGSRTVGQQLYFNKAGYRAPFEAHSLSDFRRSSPLVEKVDGWNHRQEAAMGCLLVVQVPLVPSVVIRYRGGGPVVHHHRGVEAGIVRAGASDGTPFRELQGTRLVRDKRFPVRVTVQSYKTTDSGVIASNTFSEIALALCDHLASGVAFGSLPTSTLSRTTAPRLGLGQHDVVARDKPDWWSQFWATFNPLLDIDESSALSILHGRMSKMDIADRETAVVTALALLHSHSKRSSSAAICPWVSEQIQ